MSKVPFDEIDDGDISSLWDLSIVSPTDRDLSTSTTITMATLAADEISHLVSKLEEEPA